MDLWKASQNVNELPDLLFKNFFLGAPRQPPGLSSRRAGEGFNQLLAPCSFPKFPQSVKQGAGGEGGALCKVLNIFIKLLLHDPPMPPFPPFLLPTPQLSPNRPHPLGLAGSSSKATQRNAASAGDLLRRKISDNGPTSIPAGLNQASSATLGWATSDNREWGWRGLEEGMGGGRKKGAQISLDSCVTV